MKMLRQMLVLALLALVPAIGSAWLHPKRPSWRSDEIPAAVAAAEASRYRFVDARPAADFERGHIPGALLLNEDAWDDLIPAVIEAWSEDRPFVVYCSSLSCAASHEVARRLREEAGLEPVLVLEGGWEAWQAATGGSR